MGGFLHQAESLTICVTSLVCPTEFSMRRTDQLLSPIPDDGDPEIGGVEGLDLDDLDVTRPGIDPFLGLFMRRFDEAVVELHAAQSDALHFFENGSLHGTGRG